MLDDLLDTIGGTPGRIVGIGLALGAGILIGRGIRPVAKGAIKGYLSLAERVKELGAEAGESLQDLYHEAKAEREEATAEEAEPAAEAEHAAGHTHGGRTRQHKPAEGGA